MNVFQIIFLVIILSFSIFYFLSSSRYKEETRKVSSKEYSLKAILPIGLYLIDNLKLKFNSSYHNRLKSKVVQIYGGENSDYYFRIHYASKFTYAYIGLILASIISTTNKFGYYSYLLIIALPVVLFIYSDQLLNNILKHRENEIMLNFPEIVSSVTLIAHAGLSIRQSLYLTVSESENNSIIYKDIRMVFDEINSGLSDIVAFSKLTERCRIKEVMMFVNIIKQDIRIGGSNNIEELKKLGEKCWEMRANAAKQKGEEASAKMLIPIGIMFIAVLIAIVAPVFFKMGEIFTNF